MRFGLLIAGFRIAGLLIAGLLVAAPLGGARAASSPEAAMSEAAQVRLLSDVDQLAPGDSALVALHQMLGEGWHTYWLNPGDTGEPTRVEWTAPEGVEIGDIRWPAPERAPFPPFVNYGFNGEALLTQSLSLPADWPAGEPVRLSVRADWLIWSNICILESSAFTLTIPTGAATTIATSVPTEPKTSACRPAICRRRVSAGFGTRTGRPGNSRRLRRAGCRRRVVRF